MDEESTSGDNTASSQTSEQNVIGYGIDPSTIIKTNNDDSNYASNDDTGVIDTDWLSCRFMVADKELDELDAANRYYTTTQLKFTDTSLGGNIGINPRPQFTRYCDVRGLGRQDRPRTTVGFDGVGLGMGRFYSESLDDNYQTIFMEFGVPRFNNLIDFFTRAIDYEDSTIANTGRVPTGYKLGRFVGSGVMLAAFPVITLAIWSVKLVNRLAFGFKSFDYYYMEPTMHTYWGAVNSIATMMSTEMGILIPELMNDGTKADHIGIPVRINQDDLNEMRKLFPNLISENNYIDVFAIANRSQVIANAQALKDKELYEEDPSGAFDFIGYVKKRNSVTEKDSPGSGLIATLNDSLMFSKYLKRITSDTGLFGDKSEEAAKAESTAGTATNTGTTPTNGSPDMTPNNFTKEEGGTYKATDKDSSKKYLDRMVDNIDASVRGGGMYAAFYVDYTGSVSESFSSSVGEIETGEKLKSMASGARNLKFNLGAGNISDTVTKLVGGLKDVAAGALDGITYGLSSVIQTATGNGYIDIPKRWLDSDMSLPSITYTMELRSQYGNVISQMQNIYIPLAMILAGGLPQAAGMASYTSPFLCSLFCKGVQNIKLGMITSINITRGTSNLGFNKSKRALAIDVSFTVTDFSTRVTAPVSASMFEAFGVALNDASALGNYISVLGSRDLLTSKYTVPKIKLRASRLLMSKDQMISPAAFGLRVGESLNGILGGLVADHALTIQHTSK